MHYRAGWLVERLSTLESIHLMRQGLDVRSLSAERPLRKRKQEGDTTEAGSEEVSERSETLSEEESDPEPLQPEAVIGSADAG